MVGEANSSQIRRKFIKKKQLCRIETTISEMMYYDFQLPTYPGDISEIDFRYLNIGTKTHNFGTNCLIIFQESGHIRYKTDYARNV